MLFVTKRGPNFQQAKNIFMVIFVVLWPYLLTTKLSCLQKNNFGHTKAHVCQLKNAEYKCANSVPATETWFWLQIRIEDNIVYGQNLTIPNNVVCLKYSLPRSVWNNIQKSDFFYRLVDFIRNLSTCFDVSSLTVGCIFGGESRDTAKRILERLGILTSSLFVKI